MMEIGGVGKIVAMATAQHVTSSWEDQQLDLSKQKNETVCGKQFNIY